MSPEGVISVFPLSGAIVGSHLSIDEVGDVVGAYEGPAGSQHGFIRNPYGTITTFDPPEGLFDATVITQPTGINDAGAITGYFLQAG